MTAENAQRKPRQMNADGGSDYKGEERNEVQKDRLQRHRRDIERVAIK